MNKEVKSWKASPEDEERSRTRCRKEAWLGENLRQDLDCLILPTGTPVSPISCLPCCRTTTTWNSFSAPSVKDNRGWGSCPHPVPPGLSSLASRCSENTVNTLPLRAWELAANVIQPPLPPASVKSSRCHCLDETCPDHAIQATPQTFLPRTTEVSCFNRLSVTLSSSTHWCVPGIQDCGRSPGGMVIRHPAHLHFPLTSPQEVIHHHRERLHSSLTQSIKFYTVWLSWVISAPFIFTIVSLNTELFNILLLGPELFLFSFSSLTNSFEPQLICQFLREYKLLFLIRWNPPIRGSEDTAHLSSFKFPSGM